MGFIKASRLFFGSALWKCFSMEVLDSTGIVDAATQMKLIKGIEKGLCLLNYSGERNDIALLLQMDAPESLEQFKEHLKKHMTTFPRFTSRIVKVGSEFFLKQVDDPDILAN